MAARRGPPTKEPTARPSGDGHTPAHTTESATVARYDDRYGTSERAGGVSSSRTSGEWPPFAQSERRERMRQKASGFTMPRNALPRPKVASARRVLRRFRGIVLPNERRDAEELGARGERSPQDEREATGASEP